MRCAYTCNRCDLLSFLIHLPPPIVNRPFPVQVFWEAMDDDVAEHVNHILDPQVSTTCDRPHDMNVYLWLTHPSRRVLCTVMKEPDRTKDLGFPSLVPFYA